MSYFTFSVMKEINFLILFFVFVSTTRLLFQELRVKLDVIITKSHEENSSVELENWGHCYDLACRLAEKISDIFGIPLLIAIAAYLPIAMNACSFLIQGYYYKVRVAFQYDIPDMMETFNFAFSKNDFRDFLWDNPVCGELHHKKEVLQELKYLHQQSFKFNYISVFHCCLHFVEAWLRI